MLPLYPQNFTQSSQICGQTHQPVSHVVKYSWLSVHQGEIEPFEDHPSTCEQASQARHSKGSLGNFDHKYLSKLLVYAYYYHLMEKSVSSCCMYGRKIFSNSVTIIYWSCLIIQDKITFPLVVLKVQKQIICLYKHQFLVY